MKTDQDYDDGEWGSSLSILDYSQLHQELLPTDKLVQYDGEQEQPVIGLELVETHADFLRWLYIKSNRNHWKLIDLLPSLQRQILDFNSLLKGKKYFRHCLTNQLFVEMLVAKVNDFVRFTDKHSEFRLSEARPNKVWRQYLSFCERFDRKMTDAIRSFRELNPAFAVGVDITPSNPFNEDEREKEEEEEEEQELKEGLNLVSTSFTEWQEKCGFQKIVPREAFQVPSGDKDEHLRTLLQNLKVREQEDNSDSKEAECLRDAIMSKMKTVEIL